MGCRQSCRAEAGLPVLALRAGLERPPACALCPCEGGPMKATACGRWVHCACELWVPEAALDPGTGLVDGLQRIHKVPVV